jgi:hypothetical protein
MRLLNEITESINLGNTVDEVFQLIYDRLREFIPYNRIAVAVADEGLERLSIVAARSDGKMVLGRGYTGTIAGSSLEPLLKDGSSTTSRTTCSGNPRASRPGSSCGRE